MHQSINPKGKLIDNQKPHKPKVRIRGIVKSLVTGLRGNMAGKKGKGGRRKEHFSKADAALTYRNNMKASDRIAVHVCLPKDKKESLDIICSAQMPKHTKAQVITRLVDFALKNKHLFPDLFQEKPGEDVPKKD